MYNSRIWKLFMIEKLNIIHYIVKSSVEENKYVVNKKTIRLRTS